MPSVSCVQCGATFTYESRGGRRRKYCSDRCRNLRYYGKAETMRGLGESRECRGCGATITAGKRERNPRRWCSQTCRVNAWRRSNPTKASALDDNERAKYAARSAERDRVAPKPSCKRCGSTLHARRGEYCNSMECQRESRRVSRMNRKPCLKCDRPSYGRGMCTTHYDQLWRAENPDKYAAKQSRRRARLLDAFVEDVRPSEVLDRDRWRCHICGKKIGKSYRHPHPRSAWLDHIIPLSRGGEHSMANCASAHLGCNSSKGASGGGEQFLLFG